MKILKSICIVTIVMLCTPIVNSADIFDGMQRQNISILKSVLNQYAAIAADESHTEEQEDEWAAKAVSLIEKASPSMDYKIKKLKGISLPFSNGSSSFEGMDAKVKSVTVDDVVYPNAKIKIANGKEVADGYFCPFRPSLLCIFELYGGAGLGHKPIHFLVVDDNGIPVTSGKSSTTGRTRREEGISGKIYPYVAYIFPPETPELEARCKKIIIVSEKAWESAQDGIEELNKKSAQKFIKTL